MRVPWRSAGISVFARAMRFGRVLAAGALSAVLAGSLYGCGQRQGIMAASPDVDACDKAAADPFDVNRWATGVSAEEIPPGLAVDKCTAAVRAYPSTARYHYQLGRALLANRRVDEAVASFQKANDLGYCAAKFQLGEAAYQAYMENGDTARVEDALKLYQDAEQCGYTAASTRINELSFSADDFEVPKVVQALYDGELEKLNDARPIVALYLQGVHEFMSMEFHPGGANCPGVVARAAVAYNLESAANGDSRVFILSEILRRVVEFAPTIGAAVDPIYASDINKYREYFRNLGKRDGQHLIAVHTCDGLVTQNLYDQLVAFAKMKKPLGIDGIRQVFVNARTLFGDMGVSGPEPPPSPSGESGQEPR